MCRDSNLKDQVIVSHSDKWWLTTFLIILDVIGIEFCGVSSFGITCLRQEVNTSDIDQTSRQLLDSEFDFGLVFTYDRATQISIWPRLLKSRQTWPYFPTFAGSLGHGGATWGKTKTVTLSQRGVEFVAFRRPPNLGRKESQGVPCWLRVTALSTTCKSRFLLSC